MSWTPTTFKARWSEFAPLDDVKVLFVLAEADRAVDARLFGDRTDDAVGLLAAHKLAISPQGRAARLAPEKGDTTYWRDYTMLVTQAAGGAWAVGQKATCP